MACINVCGSDHTFVIGQAHPDFPGTLHWKVTHYFVIVIYILLDYIVKWQVQSLIEDLKEGKVKKVKRGDYEFDSSQLLIKNKTLL